MACPYFIPGERCEAELWTHRARLPLGDGYRGLCSAPGHENAAPTDDLLKSCCNLGNARCERLPADRAIDSVRFLVSQDTGAQLTLQYSAEREHRPAAHGLLTWDAERGRFAEQPDAAIARLAQAFVASHLRKNPRSRAAQP